MHLGQKVGPTSEICWCVGHFIKSSVLILASQLPAVEKRIYFSCHEIDTLSYACLHKCRILLFSYHFHMESMGKKPSLFLVLVTAYRKKPPPPPPLQKKSKKKVRKNPYRPLRSLRFLQPGPSELLFHCGA